MSLSFCPCCRACSRGHAASSARIVRLLGFQNLPGGTLFDDPALVHHRHVVRDQPHNGQIVADHQKGDVGGRPYLLQKVQKIALNRDIEACGRLISGDDPWIEQQSTCNGSAPGLPAAELRGILLHRLFGQAQPVEHGNCPQAAGLGGFAQNLAHLGKQLTDPAAR